MPTMPSDSPNGSDGPGGATNFFELYGKVKSRRPRQAEMLPAAPGRPPGAATADKPPPLTVSQLTQQIDRALRSGLPQQVLVKGELSNYKPHPPSGNHYFTLKDSTSCIDCIMWRDDAARMRFAPESGSELLAAGRVQAYGPRGKYQLYVTSLQPLGQGALELAFRQLKEKLEKQGLFAAERKKPLPRFPLRIVLMTSRQAAAVQDMLKVLRPFSWLKLYVYPVPVQGANAAAQIALALHHLNAHHRSIGAGAGVDLILLGRGGGSLEDLASFNDEAVARAIAASAIPVVTGIGHEVDTSIADLVADYHAHTPTEAAQVVVRQWRQALEAVSTIGLRLHRAASTQVGRSRLRLTAIERHESFRRPLSRVQMFRQLMDDREKSLALLMADRTRLLQNRLRELARRIDEHRPAALISRVRDQLTASEQRLSAALGSRLRGSSAAVSHAATVLAGRHPRHRILLESQRLSALAGRLQRATGDGLHRRMRRLEAIARQLEAVGPEQVLRRGYSLTTRKRNGEIIRSIAQIRPGDRLVTRFAEGQFEWTAEDPRQPTLFQ